jgi:hypothetical protein
MSVGAPSVRTVRHAFVSAEDLHLKMLRVTAHPLASPPANLNDDAHAGALRLARPLPPRSPSQGHPLLH